MKLKLIQFREVTGYLLGLDKNGQLWKWDNELDHWKRFSMVIDPDDSTQKQLADIRNRDKDIERGLGLPF